MDLHVAFLVAQSAVAKSSSPANDQEKLRLYAHFKQATCGPARGRRPSVFDFRGRAKYDAWAALGPMNAEAAKRAYLDLADSHAPGWRPTQSEEREPQSQAAQSDCQQSADEDKDTGVGSGSASAEDTEDTEHVASSRGMHSRSVSVSDLDDEHAPQQRLSWRQLSGLYREGAGGADRSTTLSDIQRTADEDGVATTADAEKGGHRMWYEGQIPISWREFSGLYRDDVRPSETVSNVDPPALAPLTWPSGGEQDRGSKARANGPL